MANVFERVKALTQLIPPGRAVTYGQVAAWMGEPRAARTVGWALHGLTHDEAAGVVPWQRVVGKAGPHHARVTTSCQTHSAGLQRQLLEEEGVEFDLYDRIDLTRFGWDGPEWPVVEQILKTPGD
jgi:methylated-DNA-protein-cysteine methyltransferase-like protein